MIAKFKEDVSGWLWYISYMLFFGILGWSIVSCLTYIVLYWSCYFDWWCSWKEYHWQDWILIAQSCLLCLNRLADKDKLFFVFVLPWIVYYLYPDIISWDVLIFGMMGIETILSWFRNKEPSKTWAQHLYLEIINFLKWALFCYISIYSFYFLFSKNNDPKDL